MKRSNIVSLSVHKNNMDQRRSRKARNSLKRNIKGLSTIADIAGYSIVVWDKDGNYQTAWQTYGGPVLGITVADFSKNCLMQDYISVHKETNKDD